MGILDRSSSTTNLTELNQQEIITENLGASDVSGLNIGKAGGNVEIAIDQVDSGVVAAAKDLGSGAIAVAGDIAAAALRANRDAYDFAGGVVSDASSAVGDVAARSITSSQGIAKDSIDAQNKILQYATGQLADTSRTALEDALAFGKSAISSTQQTLGDTVSKALSTLSGAVGSAADATRSDASQVVNNIAKYGAIAAAVVAIAFVFAKVKQ